MIAKLSKIRFAFVVLGAVISSVGYMKDEEVSRFDKAKYVATQVSRMRSHLAERFGADKLSLDDATDWTLLVSHTGLRPNSPLCQWFSTHPELKKLWNNPNVKAGFTGPQYRGWESQPYSQYLTANGVVLMDGRGDKVFLARANNLPKTADELVSQISEHVKQYYTERGFEDINSAAAKYAANDGSSKNGWWPGRLVFRRRDGTPRLIWPWNWGRNRPDCPVCPTPDNNPPNVVAYRPDIIEDSVAQDEPEETNSALFIVPVIGALLVYGLKLKGYVQ